MLSKDSLRKMPVITIHIYPPDKNALNRKAEAKGMKLATYCRMLLLESLKEEK